MAAAVAEVEVAWAAARLGLVFADAGFADPDTDPYPCHFPLFCLNYAADVAVLMPTGRRLDK